MNRPITILSLSFRDEKREQIFNLLNEVGDDQLDMIMLPESWLGDEAPPEELDGETIRLAGEIAKKYNCYFLCPLYTQDKKHGRVNSAVLLDRNGKVVYSYSKVLPYWDEFDLIPPCAIGDKPGIYETDFGKIGLAVCFDVNYPKLWKDMADAGAEIVFFASDYSGGAALAAHATNHHYYIVTSTRYKDCTVFDITGKEIYYNISLKIAFSRITLDLDRQIFHQNFNLEKIEALIQECPDILQEQHLLKEHWVVLASKSPNFSVKKLTIQKGIEPLREYLNRSRDEINPDYQRKDFNKK